MQSRPRQPRLDAVDGRRYRPRSAHPSKQPMNNLQTEVANALHLPLYGLGERACASPTWARAAA